jgi:hypothetical protein
MDWSIMSERVFIGWKIHRFLSAASLFSSVSLLTNHRDESIQDNLVMPEGF